MGAGGETLLLSTSYFPDNVVERAPRLQEADTGPGGMFTLLENAGYELHQVEAVSARMARASPHRRPGGTQFRTVIREDAPAAPAKARRSLQSQERSRRTSSDMRWESQ